MDSGELKMGWARQYMPVLAEIRKRFEKEQPLAGAIVGMALHVEAKTAGICRDDGRRWCRGAHHRM